MTLMATNRLDNQYSTINSGGSMQINGQANVTDGSTAPKVNNVGQLLYATESFTNTSYARAGYGKGSWTRPTISQVVGDLRGVISGDKDVSVQGDIKNINTGNTPSNVNAPGSAPPVTVSLSLTPTVASQGAKDTNGGANSVAVTLPHLNLPTGSLFKINSSPNSHDLVETDPRFTNYKTWLGSDYITAQVRLDPSVTQKRLGDGFYEQQLVREQVAQLTGKRFLGNYQSDDQQFQALMDAGLAYAKQFKLREGVALSAEQMQKLTTPIVWLVEESFQMPDGSKQKVLTPRVYANKNLNVQASGALIMGDKVQLASTGDVVNQGLIQAQSALTINAQNILNQGGTLLGQDLNLIASQDVVNAGGKVQAQNSLAINAGRDIVANTTTAAQQSGGLAIQNLSQTTVQQIASFEVGSISSSAATNGKLSLTAGRDITLNAAKVDNAGSGPTSIIAQRDINLGTVGTSSKLDSVLDTQNYNHQTQSADVGTQITTGGNLAIAATNDIRAKATTLQASGNATLNAGNNIVLDAGQTTTTQDSRRHSSESDGFTNKSNDTQTTASSATAQATTLNAQSINVQAGNNLLSVGTDSKAQSLAVATSLISNKKVQIGVGNTALAPASNSDLDHR